MISSTIIGIICVIAYLILGPFIGAIIDGIGRKLSARMQGRVGAPIMQPLYDVQKLMNKQVISVTDRTMSSLLLSYVVLMAFSGAIFFYGHDILMSVFVLSTASTVLYFAAVVTSSAYTTIAASRELVQIMAYEPAVLLACVGFYLATGSFRVSDIVSTDSWNIIRTPGFFAAYVFVLLIKLRKSPFDVSTGHHAHQELVQGIKSEMGSRNLALFQIAEWYEVTMLFGILAAFTLNSNPWSILVSLAVIIVVYFFLILVDNVSARVKLGSMVKTAWAVTILCAGVNLLVLILIRR